MKPTPFATFPLLVGNFVFLSTLISMLYLKWPGTTVTHALDYLKFTDSSRHFSSVILKILIENRRTAHAERIINTWNLIDLKPGDIVMVQIVIQSNKKREKVAKLSYALRGAYQIIRTTGHGSYFVRKLHRPDCPELKVMAYDLYPLPSSLKPCEPVDSTDMRYLNQSHAPLINL